jgi:predicted ATP-grasp superfamily ATP-dependent carboligase
LSEGGSTSARQAITALAAKGYEVEICDPDPLCLGRFSKLVSRYHRCPPLGADPEAYLSFILDTVAGGRFDVLLPIHEQGFLFAKAQELISPHVAIALPSFASYEQAHSKVGFSHLLSKLDLPHPTTRLADSRHDVLENRSYPFVIKTAIGTASRGTWVISSPQVLARALDEADAGRAGEPLLLQEFIAGPVEHAQAVFCKGRLVGHHVYRQIARGVGGGPAVKESVRRPLVRSHLERIGGHLHWHGALSVDYIVANENAPVYIDCNPRLVEPMSAAFAGLDLVDLLIRVSKGEAPEASLESREGVRTHMAMQALLGCAARDGSRGRVLRECWRLLAGNGPYSGSREELTPVGIDPPTALPLAITALYLLLDPTAADRLPRKRWGAHLLTPESARKIRNWSL